MEVRESSIPDAGLGVFTTKMFPAKTRIGLNQGDLIMDAHTAASGYGWQDSNAVFTKNQPGEVCSSPFVQFKRLKIHILTNNDQKNLHDETISSDRSLANCSCIEGEVTAEVKIASTTSSGQNRQRVDEIHVSSEFSYNEEKLSRHFKCKLCGKVLILSDMFKRHQRLHTADRPCHCSDCSNAFTKSQQLKRHQRIHTRDRPYKCSDCGKAFNRSQNLMSHQRIHTGDRPYLCSYCGKAFTESQQLKTHQRIHTGDRPYKCLDCGKAFHQSHHLKTHQRLHTGDRPY